MHVLYTTTLHYTTLHYSFILHQKHRPAGKGARLPGRCRGMLPALADALVNGVPPLPGVRAPGRHSRAQRWSTQADFRALKNNPPAALPKRLPP